MLSEVIDVANLALVTVVKLVMLKSHNLKFISWLPDIVELEKALKVRARQNVNFTESDTLFRNG